MTNVDLGVKNAKLKEKVNQLAIECCTCIGKDPTRRYTKGKLAEEAKSRGEPLPFCDLYEVNEKVAELWETLKPYVWKVVRNSIGEHDVGEHGQDLVSRCKVEMFQVLRWWGPTPGGQPFFNAFRNCVSWLATSRIQAFSTMEYMGDTKLNKMPTKKSERDALDKRLQKEWGEDWCFIKKELLRREANTIVSTSTKPSLDVEFASGDDEVSFGDTIGTDDLNYEMVEMFATVTDPQEKLILQTIMEAGTIVSATKQLRDRGVNESVVLAVATKYGKLYQET